MASLLSPSRQSFPCHRGNFITLLVMLVTITPRAGAQTEEFRVNSYTSGIQNRPQVATFSHGGFVVVWESSLSPGDDSSGGSIQGRRFDSSALPLGGDFQINTDTLSPQTLAKVARSADDGFVVIWATRNQPFLNSGKTDLRAPILGADGDIKGRIFDGSGNPVASEFQINTPGEQLTNYGHRVTANDQGGFAVTWDNSDTDGIYFRPFGASGAALSAPILLALDKDCPALTTLTSRIGTIAGSVYLPIWRCSGSNPTSFRRFDSSGTPLAPAQTAPGVEGLVEMVPQDDGFVLAYHPDGAATWSAQRFDSAGIATGEAFALSRWVLSIAVGPGGFATVWHDGVPAGSDDDRLSIKRGRFSASGGLLSAESQVNVFTIHDQTLPDVAALPDGRFVVVWASYFSDDGDDNWSIRGGVLQDDLFADGFESGDTGAWGSGGP